MKNIFVLVICGMLAACSGTTPQVVLDPVAQQNAPVIIPVIPPIQTSPVQFQVLQSADMLKIAKSNTNTVIFGLDSANYKNLSVNLSEATRYIQGQKSIIQMLETIINTRQSGDKPSSKTGK